MSAPIQPGQEQIQNQNNEPPLPTQSGTPIVAQEQINQPINQQQAPDPFLMMSLRQEQERAARLEQELAQLRTNQQRPPTNYAQLNADFLERPVDVIDQRINNALRETIAPMQQFVVQQQQQQMYQQLKNQVRLSIPDFATLEPYVDQIMSNAVPSVQTMNAAILMSRGLLAQQGYQPQQQNQQLQTPQNQQQQFVPAQLPPSAPRLPQHQQRPAQRRALSELEKRVARENRMTDDEYLDQLELSAAAVVSFVPPGAK